MKENLFSFLTYFKIDFYNAYAFNLMVKMDDNTECFLHIYIVLFSYTTKKFAYPKLILLLKHITIFVCAENSIWWKVDNIDSFLFFFFSLHTMWLTPNIIMIRTWTCQYCSKACKFLSWIAHGKLNFHCGGNRIKRKWFDFCVFVAAV